MKLTHYILDKKGEVKEVADLLEWAKWFEDNREACKVNQEDVNDYHVSTVFLGLDHSFGMPTEDGLPVLFETMTFEKEPTTVKLFNKEMATRKVLEAPDASARYTTREKAEEGHKKVVEFVRNLYPEKKKHE